MAFVSGDAVVVDSEHLFVDNNGVNLFAVFVVGAVGVSTSGAHSRLRLSPIVAGRGVVVFNERVGAIVF